MYDLEQEAVHDTRPMGQYGCFREVAGCDVTVEDGPFLRNLGFFLGGSVAHRDWWRPLSCLQPTEFSFCHRCIDTKGS